MIGAIAGDIIGSIYEAQPIKIRDFPLFDPRCVFTDDSVLAVAVADAILNGSSYLDSIRRIGRRYPRAGYGGTFIQWLFSEDPRPQNSWGNGSAMRVSPVGLSGSFGHQKPTNRTLIETMFGYSLQRTVDDIRPSYSFDISCQGTVPEALIAFFDSDSYENVVRNAVFPWEATATRLRA